MEKPKTYKEEEPVQQKASEPMIAYGSANVVVGNRDDIKSAITGEELLNKLRPRIKALFK